MYSVHIILTAFTTSSYNTWYVLVLDTVHCTHHVYCYTTSLYTKCIVEVYTSYLVLTTSYSNNDNNV